MSLYLKYRPSDFESIVGQEQVKDILKAEVDQEKISHSYIFFGPRGTGKTSTARIFAKAINCLSDTGKPCNECENCKLINSGKTLDFVEIDAASNTQVDKIREEIIDKAIYPPTTLKKKVYIIDEVHMLSKSAFNALLKIMEEPPEYLVFILATTEIHKVPETIISRCEVFNFKRIPLEKIVERLEFICKNEKISYEKEGLELIAKISDGGLRDAIKYLEQVSIIGEINTENVSKFLGIAPERQIQDFLDTLKSNDLSEIFQKIESLQQEGIDLGNFVKDVLLYLNSHLTENLQENLTLIELLDEVYQNLKNFPSAELAYKTVIGKSMMSDDVKMISDDGSRGYQEDSHAKLVSTSKKGFFKKDPETSSGGQATVKSGKLKADQIGIPTKSVMESSQPSAGIAEGSNSLPTSSDFSSDLLLNHIESPIVKGIIKNFGHVELVDGKILITIISETNYKILTQPEKLQELKKAINKIAPNTPFEVIYMPKEEYFNKKLLA